MELTATWSSHIIAGMPLGSLSRAGHPQIAAVVVVARQKFIKSQPLFGVFNCVFEGSSGFFTLARPHESNKQVVRHLLGMKADRSGHQHPRVVCRLIMIIRAIFSDSLAFECCSGTTWSCFSCLESSQQLSATSCTSSSRTYPRSKVSTSHFALQRTQDMPTLSQRLRASLSTSSHKHIDKKSCWRREFWNVRQATKHSHMQRLTLRLAVIAGLIWGGNKRQALA
jgi:hypothetical protein